MGERASYPFTVTSRDVWAIALPASFAFITEPLVGLVDITVIGRLGDAGLLGGLVLGALVFDFIFSLAYFLRIGTAGLTAQAVGARDPDTGLLHAVRALILAVAVGVAIIALSVPLLGLSEWALNASPAVRDALAAYFHIRVWSAPLVLINYVILGWLYGRADAATGMGLQLVLHGIKIAATVALVFGAGWGVPGAALGTVIGEIAATGLGLTLFARHFGGIRVVLRRIDLEALRHAEALWRLVALNRDLMIRSASLMGAYAWFAAQGSRMGEVMLSANAILLNLLMIGAFFLDGMAQAAEQLCGKAYGANWRPAFDRAYGLSFGWGLLLSVGLGLVWYFGGDMLIGVMTTNTDVRGVAHEYLGIAALCAITFMPAFLYDGILIGVTLNTIMRNGMVASLLVFLVAALVLQNALGNLGLWLALHIWFLARGGFYWLAFERRRGALFSP